MDRALPPRSGRCNLARKALRWVFYQAFLQWMKWQPLVGSDERWHGLVELLVALQLDVIIERMLTGDPDDDAAVDAAASTVLCRISTAYPGTYGTDVCLY